MSNWTHVAGIIRVDSIRPMGHRIPLLEKYLPLPDCLIGSEGPAQVSLVQNPDFHSLSAFTLTIWGDLRDHEGEVKAIRAWLEEISKGTMIRQGVVQIENERNGSWVLWPRDELDAGWMIVRTVTPG